MQNGNGQQYEYQKVHQITPEELQKTLVLNLADFEETARYEKMTSKKPALIFALLGIFSIALGFSFPIVESFTAQSKKDDTIVENREEYVEEEMDLTPEKMDLEEAIMRMELLNHSFFIYTDEETDTIAVVYKRNNGGYGCIETSDE